MTHNYRVLHYQFFNRYHFAKIIKNINFSACKILQRLFKIRQTIIYITTLFYKIPVERLIVVTQVIILITKYCFVIGITFEAPSHLLKNISEQKLDLWRKKV